jgi:hypothetical protein
LRRLVGVMEHLYYRCVQRFAAHAHVMRVWSPRQAPTTKQARAPDPRTGDGNLALKLLGGPQSLRIAMQRLR